MTLLLDPDIRDWVVLPLLVIIVIAGWLRTAVGMYMQASKTPIPPAAQRAHNCQSHCRRVTSSAQYLPSKMVATRQVHAIQQLRAMADAMEEIAKNEAEGNAASADPLEAMMSNPMSMLGGNMVFMVQNMVMMQGIQHFFSGFILLKMPFGLTVGFKNMFQRGVEYLPDLEPSYVSSVSWYFLVMYGLRGFFRLWQGVMPQQEFKEQDIILHNMGLQNPPNPNMKQDPESLAKILRTEADNLEMLNLGNTTEFDTVEKRLLGPRRYPKKKLRQSQDTDFLLGRTKKSKKQQ